MTYSRRLCCVLLAATFTFAALPALAQQMPDAAPTRGQLLYNTHCIECHSVQIHWREARQAQDWSSLLMWVTRWQATLELNWSQSDIGAVARHLNDSIYHLPAPQQQARR